MKIYIKPTYSDKSEFPPLKREALIVALIKGKTGLSGKGFNL